MAWDTDLPAHAPPLMTSAGARACAGGVFGKLPPSGGAPPQIKVSANPRPPAPARPHMHELPSRPCPAAGVTAEPGRAGIAEGHPVRGAGGWVLGQGTRRRVSRHGASRAAGGQAAGGYSRQAPPVSHRRSPRRAARHRYQASVSPGCLCVLHVHDLPSFSCPSAV